MIFSGYFDFLLFAKLAMGVPATPITASAAALITVAWAKYYPKEWFKKLLLDGLVYQGYDYGIIYLEKYGRLREVKVGDYIIQKDYNGEVDVVPQEEFDELYGTIN